MINNYFFKPTPLYKEFMILDLISKNSNITQRELAKELGSSLSMINSYLEEYESRGFIKREYISSKIVYYLITKKGIERMQYLNIGYLNASQRIHHYAKQNIVTFLAQIIKKGFKKILLYGAGEVAEIMLQAINDDVKLPISVEAVIDDDVNKQGKVIVNKIIIKANDLYNYDHDGVLISSYSNKDEIYKKLINMKYDENKILQFFDN